jgi:hypothetical protein
MPARSRKLEKRVASRKSIKTKASAYTAQARPDVSVPRSDRKGFFMHGPS